MMWYELNIQPDDNGTWLVLSKDFTELVTFGETQQEALVQAELAIEEAIAARISDGELIPYPVRETGGEGHFVEVPSLVFLKVALYMIAKEKGVTNAQLARDLGWHREQVDRLFRLGHNSRIDQLESAFKAIGSPLRFDMPFPAAA
jgi:antitoxin HicB